MTDDWKNALYVFLVVDKSNDDVSGHEKRWIMLVISSDKYFENI